VELLSGQPSEHPLLLLFAPSVRLSRRAPSNQIKLSEPSKRGALTLRDGAYPAAAACSYTQRAHAARNASSGTTAPPRRRNLRGPTCAKRRLSLVRSFFSASRALSSGAVASASEARRSSIAACTRPAVSHTGNNVGARTRRGEHTCFQVSKRR
jgi:hypothetical protein